MSIPRSARNPRTAHHGSWWELQLHAPQHGCRHTQNKPTRIPQRLHQVSFSVCRFWWQSQELLLEQEVINGDEKPAVLDPNPSSLARSTKASSGNEDRNDASKPAGTASGTRQ